jgi:hypothetical protein
MKRMTAYRQDALRCAAHLAQASPAAPKDMAGQIPRAGVILQADHYGWFERIARGQYALTPKGLLALQEHANEIAVLASIKSSDEAGGAAG